MEKEQIRKTVIRELMVTDWWEMEPIAIKKLEDSLVEALHQALSMSGVRSPHCDLCGNELYHTYKCVNTKCDNCIIND